VDVLLMRITLRHREAGFLKEGSNGFKGGLFRRKVAAGSGRVDAGDQALRELTVFKVNAKEMTVAQPGRDRFQSSGGATDQAGDLFLQPQ
jgi:hypothetical protein